MCFNQIAFDSMVTSSRKLLPISHHDSVKERLAYPAMARLSSQLRLSYAKKRSIMEFVSQTRFQWRYMYMVIMAINGSSDSVTREREHVDPDGVKRNTPSIALAPAHLSGSPMPAGGPFSTRIALVLSPRADSP